MKISYDEEADALYIRLIEGKCECRNECLNDTVALNMSGKVIAGVEILDVKNKKIYYDKHTINIWFGNPKSECVSEGAGSGVVLNKDGAGKVIGIEILNIIEDAIEDYALARAIQEAEGEPILSREAALKCLEKDDIRCEHCGSNKLQKKYGTGGFRN